MSRSGTAANLLVLAGEQAFDYNGAMPPSALWPNGQRSFADLGQPLREVTFCVVDLETTGGSPTSCGITEIGAVKLRGGELVATFQTLVNPGAAIPPQITVLTGITDAMVTQAPRIEAVLPSLLEFIGGSVLVGHNVRFDVGFLDAALERDGRGRLTNRRVDTVALARRLVRDEVPNCNLGTLADRFGLPHRPSHRALDDALATGDLLHVLLERVGRLGVTGLDDLLALPKLAGHPQAQKLSLTERLPRTGGVYVFRDETGRALYVGKAANLRQRVRSYFSGDERRKVPQLLRETHRVDHLDLPHPLQAAVTEIRLVQQHQPRFNRQLKRWQRYTYLKLTADPFPRLSITKHLRYDGATYLGPLSSSRVARQVAEAIETAVPIRRCTAKVSGTTRSAPCAPAQLGVATCPCAGAISERDYGALVDRVVIGIEAQPTLLLDPLADRMHELAQAERYEEAADMRDRAAALSSALERRRRLERLRASGRVIVTTDTGGGVELRDGLFVRTWNHSHDTQALFAPDAPGAAPGPAVARDQVDEMLAVARWLDTNTGRLEVVEGDPCLISAVPPLPRFRAAHDPVRSATLT